MRIIAGQYGGRNIDSPHGHKTHPMSDKMRGAIFNALGDIDGLTVLDAFAGSGAVGFEALSRGASSVVFLESDNKALRTITDNAKTLGAQRSVKITQAPVYSWSQNNPDLVFDIIVADPPYDDLQMPSVQALIGHLRPNGIFVLSWPGNTNVPDLGELILVKHKSYGDGTLSFFKRA